MHRSRSFKKANRITSTGRNVIHYRRAKPSQPHCAICRAELNGISMKGGKSRRTNSRLFGGVLCPNCTSDVIKLGSRIETRRDEARRDRDKAEGLRAAAPRPLSLPMEAIVISGLPQQERQ